MQNNAKTRQQAILDIIQKGPVFNQEELALRLKEAGIEATQATLSRDLRALKISKVPGEGYVSQAAPQPRLATDLATGILRIQFSGQMGVIKTLPGLANAVASLIDHQVVFPIIGSIAGDDTILLVLREGSSPDSVLDALTPLFPEIKNRYIL
ncbi:MAG: ArgR family transcriptional regulator [Bacteroidales bacterium]|nr:ArgR family transcriptional regulator [Bacteroidales bacterium]